MYRYKLKENKSTISAKDVNPKFLEGVAKLYGKVDIENDFFSSDMETYYKTDTINKTTGRS